MTRLMIRLAVLGLAGYGAKALYDRYGASASALRQPSRNLMNRTKTAASGTAERIGDASRDFGDEVLNAAQDATDDISRRVQSVQAQPGAL